MEDISFTVMAHLPILAHNILTDMDVEALTAELQSLSKASRGLAPELRPPLHPHHPSSHASITSSIELVHEPDARSDSMSVNSYSMVEDSVVSSSGLADSHMSWVKPGSSSETSPTQQHMHVPESSSSSEAGGADSMASSVVSSGGENSVCCFSRAVLGGVVEAGL